MNGNVSKSQKRLNKIRIDDFYDFYCRSRDVCTSRAENSVLSINDKLSRSKDIKIHFVVDDIIDGPDDNPQEKYIKDKL
jgi:hypothetical protein